MRTNAIKTALAMVLLLVIGACAVPREPSSREASMDAPELDSWIEETADRMVPELSSNSFIKGRPFIIVGATGEAVDREIDGLTAYIRDRLTSRFLESPDVLLVRRHPARSLDRPYALQDLRCGNFTRYDLLLTVDVSRSGGGAGTPLIKVRAIDMKKGNWVRGFSFHERVALTSEQGELLGALQPDTHLKGLKYAPFTAAEKDEMAAYLARNLSCIFRATYGGSPINVFVDASKASREGTDAAWFLQKQLNFCNEIQLVKDRDRADWILEADARETGGGVAQFWVNTMKREGGTFVPGMATYAYYVVTGGGSSAVVGTWEIVTQGSGDRWGFLRVSRTDRGLTGDILEPDGRGLRKGGILIQAQDNGLDFTFYDGETNSTFVVQGRLMQNGRRIAAKASQFPTRGEGGSWEMLLVR